MESQLKLKAAVTRPLEPIQRACSKFFRISQQPHAMFPGVGSFACTTQANLPKQLRPCCSLRLHASTLLTQLNICLSIYLIIDLSVYRSICLSIYLSPSQLRPSQSVSAFPCVSAAGLPLALPRGFAARHRRPD